MPCNCGGKTASGNKVTYVATFSDGTTQVYSTEIDARVAVTKKGGSYRPSVER
jgi:hypothetical protein